jgi:hypothetical protein
MCIDISYEAREVRPHNHQIHAAPAFPRWQQLRRRFDFLLNEILKMRAGRHNEDSG